MKYYSSKDTINIISIVTDIICMYSHGGIQSFHGMDMESIWTWNPYGHGIHMNQSIWNPYGMEMESIWNGSFHVHSMSIPYGFHSGYGMRKWLGPQPKSFHMDSMEWTWNPYGIHMDSIWINPGRVKTSISCR